MLYAILHHRGKFSIEPDLFVRIGRILLSAAAMGAVIWYLAPFGDAYYGAGILARLSSILVRVGAGAVVYFGLAWVTGAIDRNKITMLTRKQAAN